MKFFFWFVVFVSVVCFGCYKIKQYIPEEKSPSQTTVTKQAVKDYSMRNIKRIHDDERSVTCWVLDGGYMGSNAGISCIADSQIEVKK